MKLHLRILAPIVAALLVVTGILFFLLTQLSTTSAFFRSKILHSNTLTGQVNSQALSDIAPANTGDKALLALRQGDVYAEQSDWKDAETQYQAGVDAGGGIPALKKLAQAQLERRNIDGARDTMKQLTTAGARQEDLLLLSVIIELRTGEIEKAKTELAAAGDSPQKHYGQALLDIISGNHDEAKTELQAVETGWEPVLRSYATTLQGAYDEYALFPESRPIHLETLLGRALAQVQECELALPLLVQVTNQQDDYRDAWIVQGFCNLTTERYDAALSAFERAYALDPEKPEIQYYLGKTYSALNDHKNALTFFEYALKNGFSPENDVRKMIAQEAQAGGDTAIVLEQYRAIAASSGADVVSMQNAVSVFIAVGQKDEAYAEALKATMQWPDDARAFDMLGWAAIETGRKDEAKNALEKAVQLDPTLQDAKDRLVNL